MIGIKSIFVLVRAGYSRPDKSARQAKQTKGPRELESLNENERLFLFLDFLPKDFARETLLRCIWPVVSCGLNWLAALQHNRLASSKFSCGKESSREKDKVHSSGVCN